MERPLLKEKHMLALALERTLEIILSLAIGISFEANIKRAAI
jgi:hypothetical protein